MLIMYSTTALYVEYATSRSGCKGGCVYEVKSAEFCVVVLRELCNCRMVCCENEVKRPSTAFYKARTQSICV